MNNNFNSTQNFFNRRIVFEVKQVSDQWHKNNSIASLKKF